MEKRNCQNCKKEFTIDAEDFNFYEKMQVPPPTWCPECRMIRRFLFWNERRLFRAQNAVTEKEIFSGYPASASLTLYDHNYWWSDAWDPAEYAMEYDFSKPFFSQFRELLYTVPWSARSIWHLTNSDYSNNASRLKNCYLCFDCDQSDDCLYSVAFRHAKECIDITWTGHAELCYDLFSCSRVYRVFFSIECGDCQDVWFSRDCMDCRNCFGCANLRHKQYYIFNEPYTKEQYEAELKKFNLGSFSALAAMREKVYAHWRRYPVKYLHGLHNENVVGEYVNHAKNVHYCHQVENAKDCKFCQRLVNGVANSYDYTHWGDNSESMYEAVICGEDCRKVHFSYECWPACEEVEYSAFCHSSVNLFACVGLKKKQYCILNKQYSKEEYFKLRGKIIAHMDAMPYTDARERVYRYGEFFPPELSPFAYNETIAQDFFPLTKEEAHAKGYLWRDPVEREHKPAIAAQDLPDHIHNVPDTILKELIQCADCGKPYHVIGTELTFLRYMNVALPRKCHECRFKDRFRFINPPKFRHAKCACAGKADAREIYANVAIHGHGADHCPNDFETTYAPDRPEIVYCESCYNSEVA